MKKKMRREMEEKNYVNFKFVSIFKKELQLIFLKLVKFFSCYKKKTFFNFFAYFY